MVTFKKKNSFANRGKVAEDATQKFLTEWAKDHPNREFNRLVDSKAAGRTIKAAAADFEYFELSALRPPTHGLIEVKETEHDYRLARDKVPQLARLRRRSNCGGLCIVLVLHSSLGQWRAAEARVLAVTGDKGSWNLSTYPLFTTPQAALAHISLGVFG